MKLLTVLFIFLVQFNLFAISEKIVLSENNFSIIHSPWEEKENQFQGVIFLEKLYNSKSVIATISYKDYEYQFLDLASTNIKTGKTEIVVNMNKVFQKFRIEEISQQIIIELKESQISIEIL